MLAEAIVLIPKSANKGTEIQMDVLPLVLCKDCIYWQDNNDGYPHIGCKWREDETPDPDDFCSAGESKEGL